MAEAMNKLLHPDEQKKAEESKRWTCCAGGGLVALGALVGAGLVLGSQMMSGGGAAGGAALGGNPDAHGPTGLDPESGESACGTEGSFEFQPASSVDPASKRALAKALAMLETERLDCEGGALPSLPFAASDFEKGANHSHTVHIHHKFATTCDGETFKLHFFLGTQAGEDTSFVLEAHHGFTAKDWRLLRSSPRPCDVRAGNPAGPESLPPTDKYVQRSATFAIDELAYNMKKSECLKKDESLKLKRIIQARSSVGAGMRVALVMSVSVVSEDGVEAEPQTTELIVEQKCDGYEAGQCVRELQIPTDEHNVCGALQNPSAEGDGQVLRRLADTRFFGHLQPDATEEMVQRRQAIEPRRLSSGTSRPAMQRRYIKEGDITHEYDPRGSECMNHIPMYDQGSCGSCYAQAVASMIGIRHCFAEKGMPETGRRLLEKAPRRLRNSTAAGAARVLADEAKSADGCLDSTFWTDHSGDDCQWYVSHDPGCTKYHDYGQRTHCQQTCGTCPVVEDPDDDDANPWKKADYSFMPNAGILASCAKFSSGDVAGCGGGNTNLVWNAIKDNTNDLWVMGEKCVPYKLKCWDNNDGGIVNPITTGRCSPYKGYEMWHKPCSCIPGAQRPTQYQCRADKPSANCGHPIPYAMFTVQNMQQGLSNADAVKNMQRHIAEYGPIYVSFGVPQAFSSWDWDSKPVYTGGGQSLGGHAVIGVGWGTHQGVSYWLLRNSWGGEWADKGYFKFKRGIDLDGIESSESTAAMPVNEYQDWSAPYCDIKKTLTSWSMRGSQLFGYSMKLQLACSKKANMKIFISNRIQRKEDTYRGVSGTYKDAAATAQGDLVEVEVDLLCRKFGLEDGMTWVSIAATDDDGNEAKNSHYLTIPPVPGMTSAKTCWR